ERPHGAGGRADRRGAHRAFDDPLARAGGRGRGGDDRGSSVTGLLPLLTGEETRRAEEAHDGPLDELMERAGTAGAGHRAERFPGRVAVVCGGGNNGGDGRVSARVLRDRGREVDVVEGFGELGDPDVIVDALLGIGLRDAPREDVARMIERINGSGKPVVAVDVPSGGFASTGGGPGAGGGARGGGTLRGGAGRRPRRAGRPPRGCRGRRAPPPRR